MNKPVDKLKASQLADILNVTARAVRKMASLGQIPAKIINSRGDRRFSVHELLASDAMPEEHKNSLMAWYQGQLQGKAVSINSENLPASLETFLSARIESITQIPADSEIPDPWLNIPDSCRDEGFRRYQIVEVAREIKSSYKKGRGRTKRIYRYCKDTGVNPKTLYRWIKSADKAHTDARKDSVTDVITPQIRALAPQHGQKLNFFHSWSKPALNFAFDTYLKQGCPNITDVYRTALAAAALYPDWKVGSYDSLVDAIGRINKGRWTPKTGQCAKL
ncbi:hypothetical protein [uncultured Desulfosarcina sp.]|uniref:hypothetical protein n=1 Tax=uncultured Desulfosarcina sp. TaxID=218289 RepID=UPI0029C87CF1|nr:hypothetical protein [uncultured Desulfosarcina sp.]